ncbi:hypothetical protein ACFX2J_019751 [Malus domestica]
MSESGVGKSRGSSHERTVGVSRGRGRGGSDGEGGRRGWVEAINDLPQIMTNKKGLDLTKPCEVIGGIEFEKLGNSKARKWGGRGHDGKRIEKGG